MKKSELLLELQLNGAIANREELAKKLAFLKDMFFKNELSNTEKLEYLNIHSVNTLERFAFSPELQKKYNEYYKKDTSTENLMREFVSIFQSRTNKEKSPKGDLYRVNVDITTEEAAFSITKIINVRGKNIKVEIPAGFTNKTIRLAGCGGPAPKGGEPGDLLVHVHVIDKYDPNKIDDGIYQRWRNTETKKKSKDKKNPYPNRKFLCKYHHENGQVSDSPGFGLSEKRCPGCGKYYEEMPTESGCYVKDNSIAQNDDENDMDRIQNSYL